MSEAETRAEHVAPALKAAGSGVVDGRRVLREYGITQGRLPAGGTTEVPRAAGMRLRRGKPDEVRKRFVGFQRDLYSN